MACLFVSRDEEEEEGGDDDNDGGDDNDCDGDDKDGDKMVVMVMTRIGIDDDGMIMMWTLNKIFSPVANTLS